MNEIETNQEQEQPLLDIKDNSKRAKTLMAVFWLFTGVTLIGLLSGYNELRLLQRAQNGEFISELEANTSDMIQGVLGLLQVVVYIATVVVFLNWFRRAYGNLHRLGIKQVQYQEKMALWAWFIPIIWFFRPVQIMNEIYTQTQEKIKTFDASYAMKSGELFIGLWWMFFLISNFIGRYVLKTAFKQDTIEQLIESSQATLISDVIQIPEALLVIIIVYKVSKMESKLAEQVNQSGVAQGEMPSLVVG